MARAIGVIKSLENGIFFVRETNGDVHQLKAGDTINEGDHVYGAFANMADAKIIIDASLSGAGDIVLSADGALQFESALIANLFSHGENAIYVNSFTEGLAMTAAAEAQIGASSEDKTAAGGTEAGNETAAGNTLSDTERLSDTFAARDGLITDVTTNVGATSPNIAETTITPTEITLVAGTEVTPPPPPSPEANAPILDVTLGEGTRVVTPVNSNADVNGYNLHTHNSSTGNIVLDGSANSVTIELKSYKTDVDDGQILLKDHDGKVIETINLDSYFNDVDPHNQPVTISIDTPFYSLEVLNFVNSGDVNSEFKIEGIGADMVTYSYPLYINDASLSDGNGSLGDIIVTGLPIGAVLSNFTDPVNPVHFTVESDTVTFGSDTDPTVWTLSVNEPLPSDTSIIASLTSTEPDGSTATAYVGVYGDNVIVGSDGNDFLDGSAGADTLHGGAGNDTLVYDSHDVTIDGGTGVDTLVLTGNTNIDFHTLASNSSNIEVIDLTGGDHDLSAITFSDVINMTESGSSNIYILGDGADKVGFLNSAEWNQTGTNVSYDIQGTTYAFNEYTSDIDPTVVVRVETEIPVI